MKTQVCFVMGFDHPILRASYPKGGSGGHQDIYTTFTSLWAHPHPEVKITSCRLMPSSLYGSWSLRYTSKSQMFKQIKIEFANIGKASASIFIDHLVGQAFCLVDFELIHFQCWTSNRLWELLNQPHRLQLSKWSQRCITRSHDLLKNDFLSHMKRSKASALC